MKRVKVILTVAEAEELLAVADNGFGDGDFYNGTEKDATKRIRLYESAQRKIVRAIIAGREEGTEGDARAHEGNVPQTDGLLRTTRADAGCFGGFGHEGGNEMSEPDDESTARLIADVHYVGFTCRGCNERVSVRGLGMEANESDWTFPCPACRMVHSLYVLPVGSLFAGPLAPIYAPEPVEVSGD